MALQNRQLSGNLALGGMAEQKKSNPTEADLNSSLRGTLRHVFPWLSDADVRHETSFQFPLVQLFDGANIVHCPLLIRDEVLSSLLCSRGSVTPHKVRGAARCHTHVKALETNFATFGVTRTEDFRGRARAHG